MSIITISRGSYSKGKEVAEKVAKRLDYECIGKRILLEASEKFNIPEIKLSRALHDSPSVLNRFTHGKQKYIAYIRYALLKHLQQDNIVYHGLAGHFFLKNVPHVFKVRIIADMEKRIDEEMKRENISRKEASQLLQKDDAERRKWSLHLYKIDTWDASLYDIVVYSGKMTVEEAAAVIVEACKNPSFKTTTKSKAVFDSLLLSAQIQSKLIDRFPTVEVTCENSTVNISSLGAIGQDDWISEQIKEMLYDIPHLNKLNVRITPIL